MLFNSSHPGEVLKDYLGDMTVKEAARRLGVTRPNHSRILNGRGGISAVMPVRLARAMPYTCPEFWRRCSLITIFRRLRKAGSPKSNLFPPGRKRSLPQPGYDILAEDGQHFDCAPRVHKGRSMPREEFDLWIDGYLERVGAPHGSRECEPRELADGLGRVPIGEKEVMVDQVVDEWWGKRVKLREAVTAGLALGFTKARWKPGSSARIR